MLVTHPSRFKETGMVQQHITAVYEYGFLRPLEPLSLPEKQKVHIQFLTVPEPETDSEIGPETGPEIGPEIGSEFECKPVSATCPPVRSAFTLPVPSCERFLQPIFATGLSITFWYCYPRIPKNFGNGETGFAAPAFGNACRPAVLCLYLRAVSFHSQP